MNQRDGYRAKAREVIAAVLQETEGKSPAEVEALLQERYPFGMRTYCPYRVWLEELAKTKRAREEVDPRQLKLQILL